MAIALDNNWTRTWRDTDALRRTLKADIKTIIRDSPQAKKVKVGDDVVTGIPITILPKNLRSYIHLEHPWKRLPAKGFYALMQDLGMQLIQTKAQKGGGWMILVAMPKEHPPIFTDEEFSKVKTGVMMVWSAIAADVEETFEEGEESLHNAIAIETCLDADRLKTYGEIEANRLVREASQKYGFEKVRKLLENEVILA